MADCPAQSLVSRTEHPVVSYTALKDPYSEFRLLSLKPRRYQHSPAIDDVQVYCELATVAFAEVLSYVALSYLSRMRR